MQRIIVPSTCIPKQREQKNEKKEKEVYQSYQNEIKKETLIRLVFIISFMYLHPRKGKKKNKTRKEKTYNRIERN